MEMLVTVLYLMMAIRGPIPIPSLPKLTRIKPHLKAQKKLGYRTS
uniref:Uncharacterized protein n=1 Tax=Rhizophora mucronata TaxID=61149 RepID=A0A2P2N5R9_RHIMU